MDALALRRLLAAGALLAWAALLATPHLDGLGQLAGAAALADARTPATAAAVLGRWLWRGLALVLLASPLGALAVLAMPDQPSRLQRAGLVWLPAVVAATVLAWLALARRVGSPPGPFELVLPGLGILIGAWAGLAWRRGWRARLLFLPSLAMQALLLLLLAAALAFFALEAAPVLEEPKPLSSAEKRHLVELFRDKNPRRVPEGETRTLRLSGDELDRLASWASLATGSRVRPAVRLRGDGIRAAASVRVPRTELWVNAEAAARAGIEQGRLAASDAELRIGRIRGPSLLLQPFLPFLVAGLQGDRDLRQVLPAVERLAFTATDAALTYRRVDMPPGLIARLMWGEEASQATRAAVYGQVDRLLLELQAAPEGDARFARALETAFAAPGAQATVSSAVEANRAAILALGIVLGHPRLARSVGERLDDDRSDTVSSLRKRTTLRGRNDWARHFTVSAALTVLAAATPSDAAGLLKEELDADGGSGFSFADLLADRSGTTFAEVATRDDASARRVQDRLAAGFRVDDFFPPAADLPEGIHDAELQARFGGVGGALYERQAAEIERRLARCAAYREPALPAENPAQR
jgi:hypothetical protein